MSKTINSKLADLTINKLKIHSVGLVGREEETSLLRSRLQHMMEQEKQQRKSSASNAEIDSSDDSKTMRLEHSKVEKELVFIQGYSGVGKTSLSRVLDKDIRETKTGMFTEGKFDLNASNASPFAAIAQAYSGVFQRLMKNRVGVCEEIGRELSAQLGDGAELLTYLIPELDSFISDFSVADSAASNNDGLQERWKYGFRILTRMLTSKVQPLVVCIDDLQWSDEGSLDLIESLISDIQNTNPLLIIGCYRSNEVAEACPLRTMMKNVEGKASKFGFNITDMALESLDVVCVNQIIMKMMDVDDEDFARDLAELCFQRTLGNPFFLIEFMSMLVREERLNFSIGTMKWNYDISLIENATMSTANVVDLLKLRIERMPKEIQQMLQYAACLGPTFSVSTLSTIWEHGPENENVGDLSNIIQRVEEEMLIEGLDEGRYRWVHDNVQEASLSLIRSDIDTFRFFVGSLLNCHLSDKEVEENLFDIADLVSKGDATSVDFGSALSPGSKEGEKARSISFRFTLRF